jgi:hypothetical protein
MLLMVRTDPRAAYYDDSGRTRHHDILPQSILVGPRDMAEHRADDLVIVRYEPDDRCLSFLPGVPQVSSCSTQKT